MYPKEKEILVSVIGSVLMFAGYGWYLYQAYLSGNPGLFNDFRFWGRSFLIFIPIAIVVQIIIHIIFAIVNKVVTREDMEMRNDERDKLIQLKGIRISHWIFTLGFMLAMGSQAIGMMPGVMFLTLISSGFVSAIISELAKIYFYRKGF